MNINSNPLSNNMRPPVFAGSFYPARKEDLQKQVNDFLTKSKKVKFSGHLKALIVPHAGYIYSGTVAGAGYKLLQNKDFKKVILLGPSHQTYFIGASLAVEDLVTPLGTTKSGTKNLLKKDLVINLPAAHAKEHSLEVQLPFLQTVLKDFELYALVLGEVDEEKLAKHLEKFIDEKTLIIASSDLSHYLPYPNAKQVDQKTINNILRLNFNEIEACGEKPIKVLMHLAKSLGWKSFLIDYKNSGDTAGDKEKVVGYACIGFSD